MKLERRRLLAAGIVTAAGVAFGAVALAQPKEKVIRVTARKWVFLPREIDSRKAVRWCSGSSPPTSALGLTAPASTPAPTTFPGRASRRGLVPAKTAPSVFLSV